RYWPEGSDTVVFDFSISAGLVAVTVTPGSTAPLASFTVPLIALCAHAAPEAASRHPVAITAVRHRRPARIFTSEKPNLVVSVTDEARSPKPACGGMLQQNKAVLLQRIVRRIG